MRRILIVLSVAGLLAATAVVDRSHAYAVDPLPPGSWRIAWQDEFNGTSLDATRWATSTSAYADGCRGNVGDHKVPHSEVDVFEYHPGNRTLLELSNHTPGGGYRYHDTGIDVSRAFHHFGAYLGHDRVEWYFDGRLIHTDRHPFNSPGAKLVIDLAVGDGSFAHGVPTVDESRLMVDSVRVYRRAALTSAAGPRSSGPGTSTPTR